MLLLFQMEADLNEIASLRSSDNLLTGDIILIFGYIFFARQLLFAIKTSHLIVFYALGQHSASR